jgi:hypothetical protein
MPAKSVYSLGEMISFQWAHPRGKLRTLTYLCLFLLLATLAAPQSVKTESAPDRAPILEALRWVRSAPLHPRQFDYVMTVRVRLLFFWVGKDDVGGGYIRQGISEEDPRDEFLQVLFGSDPAKAPRAINRWGAGSEVVRHKAPVGDAASNDDVLASAFFGFMKSSRGKSVSEMQEELRKEKEQGQHQFTGIISRVDPNQATSLIVPLTSNQDFTLHQYGDAEPLMLQELSSSQLPVRALDNASICPRAGEFLGTVSELMRVAMQNPKSVMSLCYVHDAQANTLTLEHVEPLKQLNVKVNSAKGGALADATYKDMLQADFNSVHQATNKRVYFTIILGTQGTLRGVPVQIRYQPNFWFQVVLNLLPQTSATQAATK